MSFAVRKVGLGLPVAIATALNDARKGGQFAMAYTSGTFTLNGSSAATVANAAFNANTFMVTVLRTATGTALSAALKQTGTSGSMAIQGVTSAGANATTDQSTYAYFAYTPTFHADQTAAATSGDFLSPATTLLSVTAANATDLPSSITLANNIRQALVMHYGDALAHLAADTTNPAGLGNVLLSTDVLATAITAANAHKASINLHFQQAGVHINNDTTNTVSTANATDLPTLQTLLNAIKTAVNAHLASAPAGESIAMLSA